jgi:hypothetical protein
MATKKKTVSAASKKGVVARKTKAARAKKAQPSPLARANAVAKKGTAPKRTMRKVQPAKMTDKFPSREAISRERADKHAADMKKPWFRAYREGAQREWIAIRKAREEGDTKALRQAEARLAELKAHRDVAKNAERGGKPKAKPYKRKPSKIKETPVPVVDDRPESAPEPEPAPEYTPETIYEPPSEESATYEEPVPTTDDGSRDMDEATQ